MNAAAVILIIAYSMPGNTPDIARQFNEPSLEACWEDAKEFVNHKPPEFVTQQGIEAVYAACKVSLREVRYP